MDYGICYGSGIQPLNNLFMPARGTILSKHKTNNYKCGKPAPQECNDCF